MHQGDVQVTASAPSPASPTVPVRFLLTFDDGPHLNTPRILARLAKNTVQPSIKALFFVQTRAADGGGSRLGHLLLHREHQEGHVLGLHTATPAGHISHTRLGLAELSQSLVHGISDLAAVTGVPTEFVRPPFWRYNRTTLHCYREHGLHMLLSEIKAYDGVDWGIHHLRRWNLPSQLRRIPRRLVANRLPVVSGFIPIVVTFHDTNAATAEHFDDYLTLLVEHAALAGLSIAKQPFYDDATDIVAAARSYASHDHQQGRPCLDERATAH